MGFAPIQLDTATLSEAQAVTSQTADEVLQPVVLQAAVIPLV